MKAQKRFEKLAKNKGFTLIELIVVILILGILAATAMPKFIDMRRQARIAAVHGLEGQLRTAIELARAAWLVKAEKTEVILKVGSYLYTVDRFALSDGRNIDVFSKGKNNNPEGVAGFITSHSLTNMIGCPTTIAGASFSESIQCQNGFDLSLDQDVEVYSFYHVRGTTLDSTKITSDPQNAGCGVFYIGGLGATPVLNSYAIQIIAATSAC